jgi:glycosyltransferase involved in cell wall biosynthesis
MLESRKRLLMYYADDGGCGYFRIKMPAALMENFGFEVLQNGIIREEEMKWCHSGNAGGICVLQRQYGEANYQIFKKMKDNGVKLIYELDDYVHKTDINSPTNYHYGKNVKRPEDTANVHKMLVEFYKMCDAITVTTEPLRQKLLPYNKNIFVVPNSFILDDWKIKKQAHNTINILWSGSSTHQSDIIEASDAVKAILRKYDNTKLILAGWDCGNVFLDVPEERKIIYQWSSNIREISKFYKLADIGIAPIKENEFNECKSINKFVEYSLCGIPTVASKFGPYLGINDEVDGFIVKNRYDKWFKAIEKIVLDNELRHRLAENAKSRCEKEFNIETNILNWVKVYNQVLGVPELDGVEA